MKKEIEKALAALEESVANLKNEIITSQKDEVAEKISNIEKTIENLKLEVKTSRKEKDITEKIQSYKDVCEILGVELADNNITVYVEGFSSAQTRVAIALIKKMRVVEAYNQGWLPKGNEQRWYCWWRVVVGSGLVFDDAAFDNSYARTYSASRLCLKSKELALDYAKKFAWLEKDIIDLQEE